MPFRYILFHKPFDVLSQFSDRENTGRLTLGNFIPVPDVYPVGRLDRDSEGLMLLTGDGALQHRLTDPRYEHPRTYLAQVEGIPDVQALESLRRGVNVQDYVTRPARVQFPDPQPRLPPRIPPIRERKSIPTTWIELTLTEGRNRQVRRMTAAVGLPTLRLIRVAIGPLRLGSLGAGQWRDLTPAERHLLLRCRYRESPRAR